MNVIIFILISCLIAIMVWSSFRCDSCGKIRNRKGQSNFGVNRLMCKDCRDSANDLEKML